MAATRISSATPVTPLLTDYAPLGRGSGKTIALLSDIKTLFAAGTVTSVTSADANATVATNTTTPVITIVSAPKLTTGRTIGITGDATWTSPSFDGSGNVTAALTLANTAVTPGSYTSTNITVDSKGRITLAVSGGGGGNPFADNTALLKNNADNTKLVRFSLSGLTTGTTRVITVPDADITLGTALPAATNSLDGYLTAADHTTYSTFGPAVLLTGTSTLTGAVTITSNAVNQWVHNGTFTASASTDRMVEFSGTLTANSAGGVKNLVTDAVLNASGTSSVQIGVDFADTFAGGTTPINIGMRVKNAGVIFGAFGAFALGEQFLVRTDQNAITRQIIGNNTSGTGAGAQLYVTVSSTGASGLTMSALSAGFTTSGINVATTSTIQTNQTGGLNIGSQSASNGQVSLWSNGIKRQAIDQNGLMVYTNTVQTSGNNTFMTFTQAAQTTAGTAPGLLWTAGAHTSSTTGTELIDINWNLARTVTIAGSTLLALQRAFVIAGPTYSAASATTWTNVTTLDVTAPTAAGAGPLTFTNVYAARFTGNIALTTAGNYIAIKEGSNAFMGQVALVAGTKAISISGLTTSDRAFVELVTPGSTTLTIQYQAVCTAGTLTLQANVAAGTINTADTSTLNYIIFRPTP